MPWVVSYCPINTFSTVQRFRRAFSRWVNVLFWSAVNHTPAYIHTYIHTYFPTHKHAFNGISDGSTDDLADIQTIIMVSTLFINHKSA